MEKSELLKEIGRIQGIAKAGKLSRFLHSPYKYLHAILFRELFYKKNKQSQFACADTFFGAKMKIALPAATDIYLTGGKTHDSEIRLARFMIRQLEPGDLFIDVGAHYGYFSLLASDLVGAEGRVHAFEAARSNFELLKDNTQSRENIQIRHQAVSDKAESLTFYEFPALYSEYNTMDINQFRDEDWFEEYPPTENTVNALPLSQYLMENDLNPNMIKIDVEGAEDKVIQGLHSFLTSHLPVIIMEYLPQDRQNTGHKKAMNLLKKLGFESFIIDEDGQLVAISDIERNMISKGLDSENIVFKK